VELGRTSKPQARLMACPALAPRAASGLPSWLQLVAMLARSVEPVLVESG
jgi:hypothetical protein